MRYSSDSLPRTLRPQRRSLAWIHGPIPTGFTRSTTIRHSCKPSAVSSQVRPPNGASSAQRATGSSGSPLPPSKPREGPNRRPLPFSSWVPRAAERRGQPERPAQPGLEETREGDDQIVRHGKHRDTRSVVESVRLPSIAHITRLPGGPDRDKPPSALLEYRRGERCD